MLADRRPGDVELAGDVAGRQLPIADEGQDLAATRFGEGPKGNIHHGAYVSDA